MLDHQSKKHRYFILELVSVLDMDLSRHVGDTCSTHQMSCPFFPNCSDRFEHAQF